MKNKKDVTLVINKKIMKIFSKVDIKVGRFMDYGTDMNIAEIKTYTLHKKSSPEFPWPPRGGC